MSQTVEVRFKGTRKAYFLWPTTSEPLRRQATRSSSRRSAGAISAASPRSATLADKKCGSGCTGCAVGEAAEEPAPLKPVLRRATPEDLKSHAEIRRSEEDARRKVMERVRAHDLVMKVSDTEWQWDRNKLTIYFTAEKRVDFRALVRDLASHVPHPHRAAADRRAGRGRAALAAWAAAAGSTAAPPGSRSCRR